MQEIEKIAYEMPWTWLKGGTRCWPVKDPEEKHELRITWNKYIERKYKYSIGKRVLNVSLTAKVLGWS